VVRQSISAGSTVPQGTTVTIWVSNGEIPTGPLPDFVGMTVEEAQAAAEEFTLDTNVMLSLTTEEVPVQNEQRVGLVVGTNPPPGTEISESASVVLQIGVTPPPTTQPENGGGGGGNSGGGNSGGGNDG
jgi:beta-lactam-binding protein with PASTA domain